MGSSSFTKLITDEMRLTLTCSPVPALTPRRANCLSRLGDSVRAWWIVFSWRPPTISRIVGQETLAYRVGKVYTHPSGRPHASRGPEGGIKRRGLGCHGCRSSI